MRRKPKYLDRERRKVKKWPRLDSIKVNGVVVWDGRSNIAVPANVEIPPMNWPLMKTLD